MHPLKYSIAAAFMFLSFGCSTPNTSSPSLDQTLYNIGSEGQLCAKEYWGKAQRLKEIFNPHTSSIHAEITSSKSYIKKSDKPQFRQIIKNLHQCSTATINRLKYNHLSGVQQFAPVLKEYVDLKKTIYDKYLTGKITTSQASLSTQNAFKYFQSKWDKTYDTVMAQINYALQQKSAQDASRANMWRAIGSGFQNYNNQQQQSIDNYNRKIELNKPVHTRCYWGAGTLNCTSGPY